MIRSTVRQLAEQPIDERRRQQLFALAAIILLLTAGLLSLTAGSRDRAMQSTRVPLAMPADLELPRSWTQVAPAPQSRERAPERVIAVSRRFLAGYLPYLYGRRPARAIEHAGRALRRQLAADTPRVPAAARRRRPRVIAVDGERMPSRARAWTVTARIADGKVIDFPVELLVVARAGRLVVAQVGGE